MGKILFLRGEKYKAQKLKIVCVPTYTTLDILRENMMDSFERMHIVYESLFTMVKIFDIWNCLYYTINVGIIIGWIPPY